MQTAATAMVWTGLALNVLGVILGSWRDLSNQFARVVHSIVGSLQRFRDWMRRTWLRFRTRGTTQEISAASVLSSSTVGSASISVWPGLNDDMDIEAQIGALAVRTDTLRDLTGAQAKAQQAETQRLSDNVIKLGAATTDAVDDLRSRLDEIDVRSVGARAFGALLVICGSLLMFVGGLLAASSAGGQ